MKRVNRLPYLDTFLVLLRKRKGLVGFSLLLFFVTIALLADVIAPNPPSAVGLADGFAYPAWFKLFPQYRDLPENLQVTLGPHSGALSVNGKVSTESPLPNSLLLTLGGSERASGLVELKYTFYYPYAPPKRFEATIPYNITVYSSSGARARVVLSLTTQDGSTYTLYDTGYLSKNVSRVDTPARFDSRDIMFKINNGFSEYEDVGEKVFDRKGNYTLTLSVFMVNPGNSTVRVLLYPVVFRVPGLAYGVLGTDALGSDIFSNLIHGTRVSLLVGVLASVISVSIGLLVGIVAGYKGGFVDQALIFLTDTLLFIPIIPLLIAVSVYIGKSLYLMIVLIALFSWMGFARNTRALVMSLRERLFVEAARAAGAGNLYIIFRHILPLLTPVVYITLVLNIPGAVLTEAALSFLNLGDPSVPSWGRMLYNARYSGAFFKLMWWWILPPGIMLMLLSMSFVLIGQALDEVFNPKLRARR
ncbi:ABC transporter permease [Infirmifilum sp. SLHALR2]